ncbi:uncharacterized protein LOC128712914 [Anopheles marshallii]|uniref:uncharacterized protein LOC128712914 n=1 Tax=Anopheles marshallii TaxID=1521116 RepID=UPI00237AFCE1|nr:uncharacterized protein LOC128712914 [Anopheles marshallii]
MEQPPFRKPVTVEITYKAPLGHGARSRPPNAAKSSLPKPTTNAWKIGALPDLKVCELLRGSRLSLDSRELLTSALQTNCASSSTVNATILSGGVTIIPMSYMKPVLAENVHPANWNQQPAPNHPHATKSSKSKINRNDSKKRIEICPDISIFKIPMARPPSVLAGKTKPMSNQQQNGPSTIVTSNPAPVLPINSTTVVLPTNSSGAINELQFIAGSATTPTSTGLIMYRPIAPKPMATVQSLMTTALPVSTVAPILLSSTVTINPGTPIITEGVMNSTTSCGTGNLPNGGVSGMVLQSVVPSHIQANQLQDQSALYATGSNLVLPFGTTIKVTQGALNQQQPQMQPTAVPIATVNAQLQPSLVHTPSPPVLQSLGTISITKPHQQPQKMVLSTRLPIASTSAGPISPANMPPLYVPPNKASIVTTVPKAGVPMSTLSVTGKIHGETRQIMVTGPANNNIVKRRMSMGILKVPTATVEQQELRKPIKAFPIPLLSPFTPQPTVQQQQQQHSDQQLISEPNKDQTVPLPSSARHFAEQCGQTANVNLSLQLENEPAAPITEDELSNDGSMLVMDLGETNMPEVKQGENSMIFGKGMERAAIVAHANGENLLEVDNDNELIVGEQFNDASNFSNLLEGMLPEKNVSYQLEVPKTPEKKRSSSPQLGATGTGTNVSPRLQKRSSSEHQQSKVKVSLSHAEAAVPQINPNRRRFSEFALVRTPPVGVTIPFTDEHYYIPLGSSNARKTTVGVDQKIGGVQEPRIKQANFASDQKNKELLVPPQPPSSAQNVSLLCNETIDVPKQIEEMLKKRPSIPKQVRPATDALNEMDQESVTSEEFSRKRQRLAKENSIERSINSRSTSMSSDSNVPAGKLARGNQTSESVKKNALGTRAGGKKSRAAGGEASNQITPSESSASLQDDGGPVYDTSTVADHLRWYDGVGYLSESTMHFEFNKFGIVQPLSDEAYDLHCQTDIYRHMKLRIGDRPLLAAKPKEHESYKCEVCSNRGRAADFVTPDFCSISCVQASKKTFLRDYIMNSTHALQQAYGLSKENKVGAGKLPSAAGKKQKIQRTKKKQQTEKQNIKKASPISITTASSTSDDDSMSSLSLNSSIFLKRQALRELMPASLDDSPPPPSTARSTADNVIEGGEDTEFNWNHYLKKINGESAPIHLFGPNPFPSSGLGAVQHKFRIGTKLEAIDPENNSLFCVCTVAEVRGYRLKLHFDGYPAEYDFWLNANSIDIFPPGWCQKTNRVLQPPASYIGRLFHWPSYLQETNGLMPESDMFMHLNHTSDRNRFEIGMAIEADDLKKSGKVCVATVADKMGDRILIHFDGWDNRYDYWVSIHSNYIHPVNWHKENNDKITAPPDWNKPFDWDKYLRVKSRSNLGSITKAEKPLFKTRPPVHFKLGQLLEVVDRKQKKLIRPAKIVATDGYEVSLCFEGWPREYEFWIEDDSPDLHPINWCARTNHPLEPPHNFQLSSDTFDGTCELKFCLSRGNSKYSQKKFHDRSSECPYKRSNWMSEDRKPLRLSHDQVQTHNIVKMQPAEETPNVKQLNPNSVAELRAAARKNVATSALNTIKASAARRRASVACITPTPVPSKRIKQEADEPLSTATSTSTPTPPPSRDPSKERIIARVKETEDTAASNHSAARASNVNESIRLARPVIEEYGPRLLHSYEVWQRHSRYLDECTEQTGAMRKNPLHWTTDEMARYIEQLPGCAEYASKIRNEEITGRSFLSLTQSDLIDYLGVKIGPAIKIYNRIIRLRQLVTTKFIQL